MKRKIAAIFAADVAGYSRLVAEDEEETLRRLASYRSVMDDFIARAGGRIFNTAGDAVLAEFSSAVEAVRCAIDIQESLRTRNLAYPASRQMSFRIGITIGDVVERDGDLLGDGVNIAARLEGIAPVGGICISRSVHEQVANSCRCISPISASNRSKTFRRRCTPIIWRCDRKIRAPRRLPR
jgi:class 3 adenylate cyclase